MALTGHVVLGQAKARAEGFGSESWDILELPGWRRWALLTVLPRSPVGLVVGIRSPGFVHIVLPPSGRSAQVGSPAGPEGLLLGPGDWE